MSNEPTPGGPLQRIVSLHTPGPWFCIGGGKEPSSTRHWVVARAPDGLHGILVAEILVSGQINGDQWFACAPSEYKANAHVIACLPELLSALERLVAVVECGDDHNRELENAYAAIAKATGMQANAAVSGRRPSE